MTFSGTRPTSCRLQYLPIEILQHIACTLDAESALAFTRTCSSIRQTCYTQLVFRTILQDDSELDMPYRPDHLLYPDLVFNEVGAHLDTESRLPKMQWADIIEYADNNVTAWADVALANCRAQKEALLVKEQFINKELREVCYTFSPSVETLLRVCPHLVLFKHPLASSYFIALGISQAVDLFRRTNSLDDPSLSLWYCASMMALDVRYDDFKCLHPVIRSASGVLKHFMKQDSLFNKHPLTLFGLGATAALLRVVIQSTRDKIGRAQTLNRGELDSFILPPSFGKMSFPHLSKHKLPRFYPESSGATQRKWSAWLETYVRSLNIPGYFEDGGGWTCYYLWDGAHDPSSGIGPPRRDIVFSTRPSEFNSSSMLIEAPWGDDNISRVYGFVRANGIGHAIVYDWVQAEDTVWNFALTPFGIFGIFGSPDLNSGSQRPSDWAIEYNIRRPRSAQGTFWLWKENLNHLD